MNNLNNNCLNILDLSDEILCLIIEKLNMADVFYSLVNSLQAVSADGELHEAERKAIGKLGVEESIVKQIEEIHDEEIELEKRRQALLFADDGIKKLLDMAINM
ncbi:hypothetical protein I4U23_027625 [Adineta vaga]|nr:hypothetical protein I4U23_027625 [Adineta vaga]